MFGLYARVKALEADNDRLRTEWLAVQTELEDTHRRLLNTMRSLRRLSEPREDEPEGSDRPATFDELEAARRRYQA